MVEAKEAVGHEFSQTVLKEGVFTRPPPNRTAAPYKMGLAQFIIGGMGVPQFINVFITH